VRRVPREGLSPQLAASTLLSEEREFRHGEKVASQRSNAGPGLQLIPNGLGARRGPSTAAKPQEYPELAVDVDSAGE
jgi:hypothetical protein